MNERFVCIKVDREERPDVDAIYMDAVQAMTGHGGWPLNAFLTPDGRAVLRRHLLPARAAPRACRAGRRSRRRRRGVARPARGDRARPAGGSCRGSPARPRCRRPRASSTRPRSTRPSRRCGAATTPSTAASDRRAEVPAPRRRSSSCSRRGEREMALHTLRAMAGGGMYDQIGGGFARYSVDARWVDPALREDALRQRAARARVPARLPGVGRAVLRAGLHETLDWVLRDLRQDGGRLRLRARRRLRGRRGQVLRLDAGRDARRARRRRAAAARRALRPDGPPNFEGRWAPVRAAPRPRAARPRSRRALRAAREQRVWPGLDDKRLTAWNALMISALADAGAALERADYLDAAVAAAPSSSGATCATATAGCCAPTTAAGRSSAPTSRTTRSCSRRC